MKTRFYPRSSISKKSTICHPRKKTRFWSSLCWTQLLWVCFSSAHLAQKLPKNNHLFSNKLHISRDQVISRKKRLYFLYIRRQNACKPVLLAPQVEKNDKWDLKLDSATSGISFVIFPLFFEQGIHT